MKLYGKKDLKTIISVAKTKFRYVSYSIFQYMCVNKKLQGDEKYKSVYEELYNFFLERAKLITGKDDYDGNLIVTLAIIEYEHGQVYVEVDKEYLDSYILNYTQKKYLLINDDKESKGK